MMKYLLIVCCIFLSVNNVQAQEGKKEFNLVISIDGDVVVSSMTRTSLLLEYKNGEKKKEKVNYSPGNLSLDMEAYNRIMSDNVESIYLKFDFEDRCNGDMTNSYDIELKKGWFEHYFFVIKIYNTYNKKYKKIFTPLEGKSYTYDYYYPGGQVLRVTKKKRKGCN